VVSDEDLIALGERLREIRGAEGLTVANMAALWGLERKTWERYEKGSGMPKANVLMGLAKMGYSEIWLLTGKGDMDAANAREVGKNARANALEPAAARVVAYNVAYLLANESTLIKVLPKDFAIVFSEVFDELLTKPGDRTGRVVSFAIQRLLRASVDS